MQYLFFGFAAKDKSDQGCFTENIIFFLNTLFKTTPFDREMHEKIKNTPAF